MIFARTTATHQADLEANQEVSYLGLAALRQRVTGCIPSFCLAKSSSGSARRERLLVGETTSELKESLDVGVIS